MAINLLLTHHDCGPCRFAIITVYVRPLYYNHRQEHHRAPLQREIFIGHLRLRADLKRHTVAALAHHHNVRTRRKLCSPSGASFPSAKQRAPRDRGREADVPRKLSRAPLHGVGRQFLRMENSRRQEAAVSLRHEIRRAHRPAVAHRAMLHRRNDPLSHPGHDDRVRLK